MTPVLRNLRSTKILTALLLLVALPAPGQDMSYLNEMPAAERVMADTRGRNDLDTRALQIASLDRLVRLLREMGGTRYSVQGANAQERVLLDDYGAHANRLRNVTVDSFGPGPHDMDSPRARWATSVMRYELSSELYADLAKRYFSPAFQARHREAMAALGVRMEAGRVSIDQGLRELSGETGDETWQSMSPEARQGAITLFVILGLLIVLGVYREMRPQQVVAGEPPLLRVGFRKHQLERITGVITNYSARLKTTITETTEDRTDGTRKVSRSSSTIMYEDFDLVSAASSHHIQTAHEHFAHDDGPGELGSYAGRPMSILLVKSPWRRKSPFVLFRQPGGAYVTVQNADAALGKLTGPAFWHYFPFAGLAFVIGSSTDVLNGVLHGVSPNIRGFFLFVLATGVWWVLFYFVAKFQQKRFDEDERPKLYTLLP